MGVFNGMFPILQGKEERARSFAAEMMGSHQSEWAAVRAGYASRETWAMQETPIGSFMLIWFEGDIEKGFHDLAEDDSEFATWYKNQIHDITGVDLGAPPQGPMPEIILEWSR